MMHKLFLLIFSNKVFLNFRIKREKNEKEKENKFCFAIALITIESTEHLARMVNGLVIVFETLGYVL